MLPKRAAYRDTPIKPSVYVGPRFGSCVGHKTHACVACGCCMRGLPEGIMQSTIPACPPRAVRPTQWINDASCTHTVGISYSTTCLLTSQLPQFSVCALPAIREVKPATPQHITHQDSRCTLCEQPDGSLQICLTPLAAEPHCCMLSLLLNHSVQLLRLLTEHNAASC